MSLSMQISRGALAVSLLLLFAVLALVRQPVGQDRVGLARASAGASVCELALPRVSAWRFAQTPADLGPLVRRWDNCRA
jgi:hypothetical protein